MGDYVCQRCGTDWEGAPGHPKSYCDEIFNEAEVKRLNLQVSDLTISERGWRKTAEDAEQLVASMTKVVDAAREYAAVFNMKSCGSGEVGDTLQGLQIKRKMADALAELDTPLKRICEKHEPVLIAGKMKCDKCGAALVMLKGEMPHRDPDGTIRGGRFA